MEQNTYEQKQYIFNKYKEWGIIEKDGDNFTELGWFNPNIHPNFYIPICKTCQTDYETFKTTFHIDNKIKTHHPNGCLWYDYFVNRMKLLLK